MCLRTQRSPRFTLIDLLTSGAEENVDLRGPSTTVHVYFEGPSEGDAVDDDGDGLEEVAGRDRLGEPHRRQFVGPGAGLGSVPTVASLGLITRIGQ